MTKTELNTFRNALLNKQAELGPADRDALAVQATSDEMDRIQQFAEREYAMNHLERNSMRMREVRAALQRMKDGVFGVCVECENTINLKRLAAVPWAATCIPCQEARERAQQDSGVESDASLVEAA